MYLETISTVIDKRSSDSRTATEEATGKAYKKQQQTNKARGSKKKGHNINMAEDNGCQEQTFLTGYYARDSHTYTQTHRQTDRQTERQTDGHKKSLPKRLNFRMQKLHCTF